MALLNALRLALGKKFTRAMETAPEAMVAIQRIETFLNTPEPKRQQENTLADGHQPQSKALVTMVNASFRWQAAAGSSEQLKDEPQGATIVSGLSLEVMPGEVLLVLGPVGCGKSSLLAAILGEIPQVGGQLSVRLGGHEDSQSKSKTVGFAAQQPFIQAGTVRDNIRKSASSPRFLLFDGSRLTDCL